MGLIRVTLTLAIFCAPVFASFFSAPFELNLKQGMSVHPRLIAKIRCSSAVIGQNVLRNWPDYLEAYHEANQSFRVYVKDRQVWGLELTPEEVITFGDRLMLDLPELQHVQMANIDNPTATAQALKHPLLQKVTYLKIERDERLSPNYSLRFVKEFKRTPAVRSAVDTLNLSHTGLSPEAIALVTGQPLKLRRLNIMEVLVAPEGWLKAHHLADLEEVMIHGAHLTFLHASLPKLRKLYVHYADNESAIALKEVNAPALKELTLEISEDSSFSGWAFISWKDSSFFSSLESLDISLDSPKRRRVFDSAWDELGKASLPKLRRLTIAGIEISGSDIVGLGRAYPDLRALGFINTGFNADAVSQIVAAKVFPRVDVLDISGNRIPLESLKLLLETPDALPKLKVLSAKLVNWAVTQRYFESIEDKYSYLDYASNDDYSEEP